jgi:hypothetical protein
MPDFDASGCHSPERAVDQRLGPPGARPVNPDGFTSDSSFSVIKGRSEFAIPDVKPTWCSNPALS